MQPTPHHAEQSRSGSRVEQEQSKAEQERAILSSNSVQHNREYSKCTSKREVEPDLIRTHKRYCANGWTKRGHENVKLALI